MFTGTWWVVASPDFDDEYLSLCGRPYLTLHQRGTRLDGEYQVGVQSGGTDGRLQGDNTVLFSFDGFGGMDPVHGLGTVTIAGDRLIIALRYHMGDEYTFECVWQS